MEIDSTSGDVQLGGPGTTDPEGAKSFYTELLGLDAMGTPDGRGHVLLDAEQGRPELMRPVQDAPGDGEDDRRPPLLVSYFTVESADETAERIKEVGGGVMNGPFDVFTSGRMVVAQDPTGAMFSVWEPKDHAGAGGIRRARRLAWNELYPHDTATAARFYGDLFGWSASDAVGGDGDDTRCSSLAAGRRRA